MVQEVEIRSHLRSRNENYQEDSEMADVRHIRGGNSAQEQIHSLTQRVGRWSSVVEHFIQNMGDPTLRPQHQETSKKTETQVWTQVMGITQILGPWY